MLADYKYQMKSNKDDDHDDAVASPANSPVAKGFDASHVMNPDANKRSRSGDNDDLESVGKSHKRSAVSGDVNPSLTNESVATHNHSSISSDPRIDSANTASLLGNSNLLSLSSHDRIASAIMEQQRQSQLQNQLRELLMQQSTLRSNAVAQQKIDEINSAQRSIISNLAGNDRNADLQRMLGLNRLGMGNPFQPLSASIQFPDQRQLQLGWQMQTGGTNNASDKLLQSLAANSVLSQELNQHQLNQSVPMVHQGQALNSMNETMLRELLLSQSRTYDNINRRSPTPTNNSTTGLDGGINDQSTSSSASMSGSGLEAAAARLLSPRNKDTGSDQRHGQLKVGDESGDNYQNRIAELLTLQRYIQNRPVADVPRDTSLLDISRIRALYAMGALETAIDPSKLLEIQRIQNQQQSAVAEEAIVRATALQSLLAIPNTSRIRDRTTIPNTSITTLPMESDMDADHLSKYQVLIRRQLEYFVSQDDDAGYSVQGRKKQIIVGQVGIRCRHCSYLPHRLRGRGAGYYPAKLSGVYQAAQNMATNHLNQFCNVIPSPIREELCSLRGGRHESAAGGGKQYWANKCVEIGLIEYDDGVYFKDHITYGTITLPTPSAAAPSSTR